MNLKIKKVTTYILTLALIFGTIGKFNTSVKGETKQLPKTMEEVLAEIPENEQGTDYIIMTNEESNFTETLEKVELKEETAQELREKFDNIIIEKDFVLEASLVKKSNDNSKEQFNKKRKDEKKKIVDNLRKVKKAAEENAEPEWNLQAIDALDISTDANGQKVKVAVLDSGVDIVESIDLSGSINLVPEEEEINTMFLDVSGHGTAIASVIAGNSKNNIQGVNPNTELYSVKVLDGKNKAPVSRIIEGIYWCINNDMKIINMSFGTKTYSKALETAVQDAYDAGILMIAASGNTSSEVEYPAAFSEVMAVASTDTSSQISDFSNTGNELEIAAPGEKIKSAGFFGGQIVTHGTSIAVPHVTGAASILWQKDLSKSNEFIRQLLAYSTKDIENSNNCGLLDIDFALDNYDDFSTNWNGEKIIKTARLPENDTDVETFEEIDDDENYVEGMWSQAHHQVLAGSIAVVKAGAIFPDNDPDMKGLGDFPEYHGGYAWSDVTVNYIACYELMTEIALNNGSATGLSTSIAPGMNTDVLNWFKVDFTSTYCGSRTWSSVLSSYGNTAANRKYFSWGIALHILGDIFAHKTYQKSTGKLIVHKTEAQSSTQMWDADDVNTVVRRYKVATRACADSISCMNAGVYGDYMELDYGLKQALESSNAQNFTKKKLLSYAQTNSGGLTSAETARFTAANQN